MNVRISNFKPKKDLPFPMLDGTYEAVEDGEHLIIKTPDGTEHALKIGSVDNDYFSCTVDQMVIMTQEELVEMIHQKGEELVGQHESLKEQTAEMLWDLMDLDPTLVEPFNDLLKHIDTTYDDKYNTPFPEVDNYWLKYNGGKYSSGFNVGSAASYLKRYLSSGFEKSYKVEDLYKTIHFLLYEIYSRKNNLNGES